MASLSDKFWVQYCLKIYINDASEHVGNTHKKILRPIRFSFILVKSHTIHPSVFGSPSRGIATYRLYHTSFFFFFLFNPGYSRKWEWVRRKCPEVVKENTEDESCMLQVG